MYVPVHQTPSNKAVITKRETRNINIPPFLQEQSVHMRGSNWCDFILLFTWALGSE